MFLYIFLLQNFENLNFLDIKKISGEKELEKSLGIFDFQNFDGKSCRRTDMDTHLNEQTFNRFGSEKM